MKNMKAAALKQDRFSFNTALNSCEKVASWRVARDLLKVSGDLAVSPDTITHNSVLNVCAGCSHWETASSTLSKMQRMSLQADVISHSSALASCGGRWVQARVLLGRMQHANIRANVLTLNTLINSLEEDPMSEPRCNCNQMSSRTTHASLQRDHQITVSWQSFCIDMRRKTA